MYKIERISEPFLLAEGPHWNSKENVLYFVDIFGFSVHKYDPKNKVQTSVKLASTVGAVIPIKNNPDKFVIGYGTNVTILQWDGQSTNYKLQHKFEVEKDKVGNRFNDAKADVNGNLFIGTMGPETADGGLIMDRGSLYRVTAANCKSIDNVVTPVSVSNGIAWNRANNIMYYIDSLARKVFKFDYDLKTASISNRRTFFDFSEKNVQGLPDGMTIDSDDNLWIACWTGSKVIQVSKEGNILQSIDIPTSRVTSVIWGGPNLDILYVTTMKFGLSEEELAAQPYAGCVFAVTGLGVRGRESNSVSECLLEC